MDFSFSSLFTGLVVSSIGGGMFMYGKATQKFVILGAGIVLSILPFFIASAAALWALTALTFFPLYTYRHNL